MQHCDHAKYSKNKYIITGRHESFEVELDYKYSIPKAFI
jgi:hypothetical protein